MSKGSEEIKRIIAEREISLSQLSLILFERKKIVLYTALAFFILGIVVAFTTPNEYVAEATMLSEDGSSGSGAASGLSELIGISSAPAADFSDFGPGLYPIIVSSKPFLLSLLEEKFVVGDGTKTLEEFFYSYDDRNLLVKLVSPLVGIPKRIVSFFEKKETPVSSEMVDPDELTVEKDSEVALDVEKLDVNQIDLNYITLGKVGVMQRLVEGISVQSEGRFITLTVTMPDPKLAASLNVVVFDRIIEYVIRYQTEKQQQNLLLLERGRRSPRQILKKFKINLQSLKTQIKE